MCEKMQQDGVAGLQQDSATGLQQLWESWSCRLNDLQDDPKVSRLINSSAGRYVSSHPVVALALLLFAALAMLPVGLFLAFAVVTLALSAVCFVAVEVFLLFTGGLSLLCLLFGIAMFSVVVSLFFNVAYSVIFSFLGYSQPTLAKLGEARKKGAETSEAEKAQ